MAGHRVTPTSRANILCTRFNRGNHAASSAVKRFFRSAGIHELEDLTEVAEHRLTGIKAQIRANLVPPLLRQLRGYPAEQLRADALAALTVAVVTIPQAIGFALIVGLPVQAVVATAVIGGFVCSLYSSSRHLVFGPTTTISIILAGTLVSLGDVPLTSLQKVLILGCLIGLIQLVAGLARLGQLAQFISRTVVIAYTTAVGILIAAGQTGNLLGVGAGSDVSLPGTIRHLVVSFVTLDFNQVTAAVGAASFALVLAFRRLRPSWPDGLLVLGAATAAAWSLDLGRFGVTVVGDLGAVAGSMPIFVGFPLNQEGLALVPRVFSAALAVALLGMLEAVSIAKSLATRSGERILPDQELIGMGLGNITATAFGAMPGSASFLRSATQLQSGGRTQFATVLASVGVLATVIVISPVLNHIPVAALAAYLVAIALRLIRPHDIMVARRATRADAAVFWVTLIAALFLQLDTAIYVGVGFSLMLFLQKASAPTLVEYAFNSQGDLAEIDAPGERNNPQVSIVHVEGDLFFGAADIFQDGIRRLAADPNIRIFILRMKNARHLDATTVMALGQLHEYLQSQGRHLLMSGVHGDVAVVLKRSGLARRIGLENIFPAEDNPTLATKRALQRAKELLPGVKTDVRLFYNKPPPS